MAGLVHRTLTGAADGTAAPALFARALPVFERHYAAESGRRSRPYPGVVAGLTRIHELGFRLAYPQPLGAWPACLLLLAFSWTELVYPNAALPAHIAWLMIAYSVVTWAGMLAFGRDVWLRHGEVFSLVFGTLARFAPTAAQEDRLLLRPFGSGLLASRPVTATACA